MTLEAVPSAPLIRLRRSVASVYLKNQWGLDYAQRTLAKLACLGGGPKMQYAGRFPLYAIEDLDAWAAAKISPPVSSTSERNVQRRAA